MSTFNSVGVIVVAVESPVALPTAKVGNGADLENVP